MFATLSAVALAVPVDPNAQEAREWMIRELAKPEYRASQPNWFDRASLAFWEWLKSLSFDGGDGPSTPVLAIIAIVIGAVIIAALLIGGVPRFNRRSNAIGELFGVDDSRSSEEMRRAAEDAAARSDWIVAIEEIFRSIARRLSERTLVNVTPGTTAQGFAGRASSVFPQFSERLPGAASAFDDVRYLGRPGAAAAYKLVAELERDLRGARPLLEQKATAL